MTHEKLCLQNSVSLLKQLPVHISKPTSSKETLGGNGVSALTALDCAPPSLHLAKILLKIKRKKMELDGVGIWQKTPESVIIRYNRINWCQVTGTLKRTHCHCSDIFDKNKGNINLSLKNVLCKFQSIDNYSFSVSLTIHLNT